MNYNWDWGVFFKSTGVGSETYLDWYITGLGWTIAIAIGLDHRAAAGLHAGRHAHRAEPPRIGHRHRLRGAVPQRAAAGAAVHLVLPGTRPAAEGLQDWFKQDLNPTTSAYQRGRVPGPVHRRPGLRTGAYRHPGAAARPGSRRPRHGLQLPQIYWNVLLPQAYRIIIPPLTSEFLNVFKNSSVASLIGLMELLAQTKQTAEFSANLFEAFTLATLIYFTLNMSLMLLMRMVEKKVAVPGLISVGVNNGLDFSGIIPPCPACGTAWS
jgi:glutamate/aspartate transport system permease protein